MCKYSKLNLNTFTLSCCYAAAPTCCVGAAMQQLSVKVFKLILEYLHIYTHKMVIFTEKNSKIA